MGQLEGFSLVKTRKKERQKQSAPERLVHTKVMSLMTVNKGLMESTAVLSPLKHEPLSVGQS